MAAGSVLERDHAARHPQPSSEEHPWRQLPASSTTGHFQSTAPRCVAGARPPVEVHRLRRPLPAVQAGPHRHPPQQLAGEDPPQDPVLDAPPPHHSGLLQARHRSSQMDDMEAVCLPRSISTCRSWWFDTKSKLCP